MNYPRSFEIQRNSIKEWRELVAQHNAYDKPFMQPLYVVLEENEDFKPIPIQLGFRIGVNYLLEYFQALQSNGVNHVAINLRFDHIGIEKSMDLIAEHIIPMLD